MGGRTETGSLSHATRLIPPRNKIAPVYNGTHADTTKSSNALPARGASLTEEYTRQRQETSQLVWREKPQAFRSPIRNTPPPLRALDNTRMEPLRSPPRPLERNLAVCDFPQAPPLPSTEEVMNELHEVTLQYINCDDPVESAARRQRVLHGDAQGDMEEAAARIIAAAATANTALQPLQTAPPVDDIIRVGGEGQRSITTTRKRGQPSKKGAQSPAPRKLTMGSASKRLQSLIVASPARTTGQSSKATPSTRAPPRARGTNDRPSIPAAPTGVGRSSDFHTQDHPLP